MQQELVREAIGFKFCGAMSQEMIDATVYKYLVAGWRTIGCVRGLAFISPDGNWVNYINTETGDKWHLNRKRAEENGFYVSFRDVNTSEAGATE